MRCYNSAMDFERFFLRLSAMKTLGIGAGLFVLALIESSVVMAIVGAVFAAIGLMHLNKASD